MKNLKILPVILFTLGLFACENGMSSQTEVAQSDSAKISDNLKSDTVKIKSDTLKDTVKIVEPVFQLYGTPNQSDTLHVWVTCDTLSNFQNHTDSTYGEYVISVPFKINQSGTVIRGVTWAGSEKYIFQTWRIVETVPSPGTFLTKIYISRRVCELMMLIHWAIIPQI